jgi:hypothetical protein
MGFNPAELPFLTLRDNKGFGTAEIDYVWTRGNDINEARKAFRRLSGWRPAVAGKGV